MLACSGLLHVDVPHTNVDTLRKYIPIYRLRYIGAIIYDGLATPVELRCLKTTPPQVASKPKTKILLHKCLFLACFSMLLRQVSDNLERSSECDSSELSDPTLCRETLQRTKGALTPLLCCCKTFRRATGALKALPLHFRSSFAAPPPFLRRLRQSFLRI